MDNLDMPAEGQPVSAGWLAGLLALVRRMCVSVEAGCGLSARQTPGGTVIGYIPPPTSYYMVVTEQVQFASDGPGKGKGKYVPLKYMDNDVAKWGDPVGNDVVLYSMDSVNPTASGKKVIVNLIEGRPHIIVELC